MLISQEQLPIIEIDSMNELHNEEIARIAKLYDVAKGKDAKLVFELLNELIEHYKKHFADEEKLMQEVEHPDYHAHKHEHIKQILDLEALQSFLEMTNDIQSIPSYLEGSLTPWIIEHVETWDSMISKFIVLTKN
ncbi:hemerythrin family protein [Sulfurimonas sp.]|jgi:hemerythrin|uniref:bacteriohemerythrin n=1 Tax=Sulfurimonas sp. TaxID=2022749 RepID=UPI0025FD037E|nr:hemerythrin family protein [Sulfurimonas sp.]MBT5934802.1 hemerythrin family protein [Sulfurimonas sp.]